MPQPVPVLTRIGTALVALVVAVVGAVALVAHPLPARAAEVSSTPTVVLGVSPAGPVSAYTKVTFTVRVTPASTTGLVRLLANGLPIGSGVVSGGRLSMTTTQLPVGTLSVVAELSPYGGAPAVTSSPVSLVVTAAPQIWLTTPDGALVQPGGRIRGGTRVIVHLAQFMPGSTIDLFAGTRSVVRAVVVDANGNAAFGVTIPKELPSAVYLLAAFGGGRTASFPFYVFNPPGENDDDPTPSPTRTPTPAPSTTGPDNQNISVVLRRQRLPDTGGDPNLAHTGSDAQDLVVLAAIALALGCMLVVASSRRPARGRHHR